MLAFIVVKAEPSANPSLGLGNVLIGIEVDFLVFQAAPQPLDKDVVHAAALAVHTEVAPFQWTVCQLAVYVLVMAACMSAS